MAIKLGSTTISKLYLGSTEITKAYLGSTEVYSTSGGPVVNDAFELTVETTAANESFLLPIYLVTEIAVDWGDGTIETGITSVTPTHTYATAGTYSISVTGTANRIIFDGSGSENKLRTVTNLGDLGYTSFRDAFRDCTSMTSFACGDTDISGVNDLQNTFRGCSSLTSLNLSGFDTSSVTSMSFMFQGVNSLASFDLSGFNTASVTDMSTMFGGCASATSISVAGFNTSSVTNMSTMFQACTLLENLDIDGWDVTALTNGTNFLNVSNNALTTAQYDAVLIAWAAQSVQSNVTIHFGDAQYTAGGAAETARNTLVSTYGWTITDGGAAFSPASLFASSEQGAWYDPSDLTTLWTDTAGTTQATVGDAVARMDDKSGNGNHMTQATAAARPILRQSGSLYYLEFDGVDDFFITPTGALGGSSTEFTLAVSETVASEDLGENGNRPFALGSLTNGTAVGTAKETFCQALDGSLRFDGARASGSLSVPLSYVRLSTRNGTAIVDRINAVENINTTESLSDTVDEIVIGYSLFAVETNTFGHVVVSRELTAQEISDLEDYLATKAGVTL